MRLEPECTIDHLLYLGMMHSMHCIATNPWKEIDQLINLFDRLREKIQTKLLLQTLRYRFFSVGNLLRAESAKHNSFNDFLKNLDDLNETNVFIA